jgi:acetyl esterase/lipase
MDPAEIPTMPGPADIDGWKAISDLWERPYLDEYEQVIRQFEVSVATSVLGGVSALEITPKGWRETGKVLVYTHGGGYTMGCARSNMASSALVAARTGLRVISIDYTNAPRARWQEITGEVIMVLSALVLKGFAMKDIALFGDSAGGGLAAGAVLKMRDAGLDMPAALVLWSPWADITETGDTYVTLRDAESTYLYETVLGPSAAAYADPKDQKNPYVSPVYGDFTKGFPPTLIQGGIREIFLSNFVRLYQALDMAGQVVKLDIYEGMPHDFQVKLPQSPESITALNKMKAFLVKCLGS